jgi:uncharacterized protein (DUF433 family)
MNDCRKRIELHPEIILGKPVVARSLITICQIL